MKYFLSFLLLYICVMADCQTHEIDSLNVLIAQAKSDTAKINLINAKIRPVGEINLDSAIALALINIKNAVSINYPKGEADGRVRLANNLAYKGEYNSAKNNLFTAEKIYKRINDSSGFIILYSGYGVLLSMQNQYQASIKWLKLSIMYAEKLHNISRLQTGYMNLAISYQMQSDFGQALTYYQKALQIAEQMDDVNSQAYSNLNIAITYESIGDTVHAEQSFLKSIKQAEVLQLNNIQAYACSNLATLYGKMNNYQKAYNYAMKAYEFSKAMGDVGMQSSSLSRAAIQLSFLQQPTKAETMVKQAMRMADSSNQAFNIYQTCSDAGVVYSREGKNTEAIAFYEKAFSAMKDGDLYDEQIGQSYFDLSDLYEKTGDYKKALAAYKKSSAIQDSLTSKQNIRKATELTLNYEFDKKQQALKVEQQKKDTVTTTKQTALLIGLIVTVLLAAVAFNGYRNKQKANQLLQKQKAQIESTLSDLKTTQIQLVHAEKMASLGELTAGIAHEIQNPLNFVNNFSEVNNELIEELKAERETLKAEEQEELLNDIFQNNEKIAMHGKRADAIVKGMLQHSRQSSGIKEPTDINALCDEYLRLSYHGLRAKDKNFNAGFTTDFDAGIGKINIVPQDIGRVLLNIINNAFYAVNEKQKNESMKQYADYKPIVSIQTKKINNNIKVIVGDNGNGISQNIIDKIFQPFFTTKPTGQGTGLGLSLAYDIITKQHNGNLKVESKEGEGTNFIIELKTV